MENPTTDKFFDEISKEAIRTAERPQGRRTAARIKVKDPEEFAK